MTETTANALYRYFEVLYYLNQNLITLCGINLLIHKEEQDRRIDEVVSAIPRLIPYCKNKKTSNYQISKKDGLLAFSNDLSFLDIDYKCIFQKHKECLVKVIRIRNKLQHKMHGANIVSSSKGTTMTFSATYEVEEEFIELNLDELIALVQDLNNIFSKIQDQLRVFAAENNYEDHQCYRRLTRCSFSDINQIFKSNLLHMFGKMLLPF